MTARKIWRCFRCNTATVKSALKWSGQGAMFQCRDQRACDKSQTRRQPCKACRAGGAERGQYMIGCKKCAADWRCASMFKGERCMLDSGHTMMHASDTWSWVSSNDKPGEPKPKWAKGVDGLARAQTVSKCLDCRGVSEHFDDCKQAQRVELQITPPMIRRLKASVRREWLAVRALTADLSPIIDAWAQRENNRLKKGTK